MILRNATIQYKGYDPDLLKSQSNKRICCSCDICGKVRYKPKQSYKDLCHNCKMKSQETRKQMSESAKIKILTDDHRFNISKNNGQGMLGKHHLEKSKIKSSCTKQNINIKDFNGFISEQKYCSKFNESLKQSIRDKYNNCDYISGIHKDICSPIRNLSVHHVNYDKQCGCDGNKCKLIPLSNSNHVKTNTNRVFWNKLFKYSLEYDKEYYKEMI